MAQSSPQLVPVEIDDVGELGFDEEQFERASMVDFSVDRSDELPVGVQLTWKIRAMIAGRVLRPGDRLPSVRELAGFAEVNTKTARGVYARLTERGLIASEHGRGTFVADEAETSPGVESVASEAIAWARERGIDPQELAVAIYAAGRTEPVRIGDAEGDQALLRRELRSQISKLEAELGHYPKDDRREPGPAYLNPEPGRLMSAKELEGVRDELIERLSNARAAAERRGLREQAARGAIEDMVNDPGSHRWEMITTAMTGDPDCRNWRVVPRFGPVGAIAGWWRVKVSSGCPLSATAGGGRWSDQ